jgi:hypothetical protein
LFAWRGGVRRQQRHRRAENLVKRQRRHTKLRQRCLPPPPQCGRRRRLASAVFLSWPYLTLVGLNVKIPPNIGFQKFVKMTNHFACISLTNFVNEGQSITGNGNYVNLQKLAWKNS